MAEIILIYPQIIPNRLMGVPLGLLFLAAELERRGFEVLILDQLDPAKTRRSLKKAMGPRTLFVGVSSMTGIQIKNALSASKAAKGICPDVPIVWGGVHASLLPESTIDHETIDYVVIGEGEKAIGDLAETLKEKKEPKHIQGLAYKTDSKVRLNPPPASYGHMDDLARPAWHHIEHRLGEYLKARNGRMMVQYSRGCPYNCGFCYNKCFNRQRHRSMSVYYIADDLKFLVDKFGIRRFDFCDDNFLISKGFCREFCQGLKERKLDIDLQLSVRANILDEEVLSMLSSVGVTELFIGMESGSESVLVELNKRITLDNIKRIASLLPQYNIRGFYSFMFNFFFENRKDILQTKQLAEYIREKDPNSKINLNAFVPYPGTDLYERMEKQSIIPLRRNLEDWMDVGWDKTENNNAFSTAFLEMWKTYFDSKKIRFRLIKSLLTYRSVQKFRNNNFVLPFEHKLLRGMKRLRGLK